MKQLLLYILASFTLSAYGQDIKGVIKDSEGSPVASATVAIVKAKDTAVVKLAVSTDNGSYHFTSIPDGNYRISISHVNYKTALSIPFTVAGTSVTPETPVLTKLSGDLKGVVVTARKPIVEVRADKTVLNVEGTMNETGSDGLELLRRSPGVLVDKDENLSLAGKNGVQVYVDNKPMPLSGQDLANYLKSLQSSQIEAIEIITNPSAKYEAAGNAGIINIRLKRNKAYGTNGSANAGYSVGVFSRYNGGLNLNHRNKNINIYGNYSGMTGMMNSNMNLYRTVLDSIFDQRNNIVVKPVSHNYKVGVDYTIDKKSSIGVILNGMAINPEINSNSTTKISYQPTGMVTKILKAGNKTMMERSNYNINLNYNYNILNGTSLVVNADKGRFDLSQNQYQPNTYYDATGQTALSSVIYNIISPTIVDINSVKADYEHNIGKGKLGVGGKTAFIKTDNDFQRYNVFTSGNELDRDRSNRFEYKENINAGYINYNRAFKAFMLQVGLRVENTVTKGTSTGEKKTSGGYQPTSSTFDRDYLDLFPSAAISFNKNPMKQWSLSYSRRIDRPAYQDLNPFEFKLDEYTSQKGNVDLKPQYTNSVGVTHTYKYKLTVSMNYSHVNNLFTQIIDTIEKSKGFITKKNLATQNIGSLNISYPFSYKSLTIFGNINSSYSQYKADFGNNKKIDLNAFGLTAMTQASYKFAKTWTAELTGFYNAPTVYQGTFKAKSIWMIESGVQKQVFNGKGNIKAAVGDIFNSLRFKATSDFAGQHVSFNGGGESRQFKLNFTYRFGSTTVKAAKQKQTGAEDELKRAQGDGGGIGPVKQ